MNKFLNNTEGETSKNPFKVALHVAILVVATTIFFKIAPSDLASSLAKDWQEEKCSLLHFCPRVEEEPPLIVYEREFNGKKYTGSAHLPFKAGSSEITPNTTPGSELTCFINPRAPFQMALSKGGPLSYEPYIYLILGTLFALFIFVPLALLWLN